MTFSHKARSAWIGLVTAVVIGAGFTGIPKSASAASSSESTGAVDPSSPRPGAHISPLTDPHSRMYGQGESPLMGFGWNFGLGFGYGWSSIATLPLDNGPQFGLEFPSFEFRLLPTSDFSLDFQWRFSAVLSFVQPYLTNWPFMFVFMPHFRRGEFSIAPGVMVGHSPVDDVNVVGFLGRIGGEVLNPEYTFGFGVHFKPAFVLTGIDPRRPHWCSDSA